MFQKHATTINTVTIITVNDHLHKCKTGQKYEGTAKTDQADPNQWNRVGRDTPFSQVTKRNIVK